MNLDTSERIKIGYIDDEIGSFQDYRLLLEDYNIDLIFAENCESIEDILQWIIVSGVEAILVDFKLLERYDFNGAELIYYLNNTIPDLVCVIVTSYPKDSEFTNLVPKNLIIAKENLFNKNSKEVAFAMRQSALVFRKRFSLKKERYFKLFLKKKQESMTSAEEEQFLSLYKILRDYGEVDDIPPAMLTTQFEKSVNDLLCKLDKLLEE